MELMRIPLGGLNLTCPIALNGHLSNECQITYGVPRFSALFYFWFISSTTYQIVYVRLNQECMPTIRPSTLPHASNLCILENEMCNGLESLNQWLINNK